MHRQRQLEKYIHAECVVASDYYALVACFREYWKMLKLDSDFSNYLTKKTELFVCALVFSIFLEIFNSQC